MAVAVFPRRAPTPGRPGLPEADTSTKSATAMPRVKKKEAVAAVDIPKLIQHVRSTAARSSLSLLSHSAPRAPRDRRP